MPLPEPSGLGGGGVGHSASSPPSLCPAPSRVRASLHISPRLQKRGEIPFYLLATEAGRGASPRGDGDSQREIWI